MRARRDSLVSMGMGTFSWTRLPAGGKGRWAPFDSKTNLKGQTDRCAENKFRAGARRTSIVP